MGGDSSAARLGGRVRKRVVDRGWRSPLLTGLGYLVACAVVAVPVASLGFLTDSRSTVLAGHDAIVSPTSDGYATIDLGAYLPNVRYPTDSRLGVYVDVGKTNLDSYDAVLRRYALLASSPDGEIAKISSLVRSMALENAVRGGVTGLALPVVWALVGVRRRDLARWITVPRAAVVIGLTVAVVGVWVAWPGGEGAASARVATGRWRPVEELLPGTTVTGPAARLQVQSGLITRGTQQLIASAFDTYHKSLTFYSDLEARAPELAPQLRPPADDEVVAVLVSDRHDNVGMDPVVRAVADVGGATLLFDAGDDTSTGEPWEAFSLDSLAEAFEEYDGRYAVTGNHDEGAFVDGYLDDRGFTTLHGEPVEAAGGIRLLGAPDPRSSGLGSWRSVTGGTVSEQSSKLADLACAADEDGDRVSTLIVHDGNAGRDALGRGCVDLVLSGHLHVQVGPTPVTGSNGRTGASYTNGTTGGAAYAFALGSKLRRDASLTLVTYRDGLPVGLQPVTITTDGRFVVSAYQELPRAQQP